MSANSQCCCITDKVSDNLYTSYIGTTIGRPITLGCHCSKVP